MEGLYHELHLQQLTVAELTGKLAELLGLSPGQILRLSRQGPAGIHVLVSDAVRTGGTAGEGRDRPRTIPAPRGPQCWSPPRAPRSAPQMIRNLQDETSFVVPRWPRASGAGQAAIGGPD
ncbi:hypothetical protein IHE44_0010322 [Lamprotornis superbus]|uniref:GRHL1/CP2 C-terminal domain-containing protein n=1 Tax=Lamprotornis superbus TaxID=245042 RepID=A0A835TN62_9PASS|nr:hypothetical protein IHE44_0010322 [Lamprotornis superbus]